MTAHATPESARIEALDVLRGFAVLGILLLNIIGFGLPSSAYFNPLEGSGAHHALNLAVWGGVDILFEGAMRGLFSILFGAGMALFLSSKSGAIFFRRNAWLLVLGLVNGWLLLWNGDILVTYAIAGFVLYFARNASPRQLLLTAALLIVLTSLMYLGSRYFLQDSSADPAVKAAVTDLSGQLRPSVEINEREIAMRRESYAMAYRWNSDLMIESYTFVLPLYLLPDALIMMLIGIALFRLGVLSASRSVTFYTRLCVAGFAVGLLVNGYEVMHAVQRGFDLASTFAYMQPTYHFGRLGMALGYVGGVMLICKLLWFPSLRARLAAAGRMALTNYLTQSLICMLIFTGAGLGLVGQMERWMLYIVVAGIWTAQLAWSSWWLQRFRQGPIEWLWRGLTYSEWPSNRR